MVFKVVIIRVWDQSAKTDIKTLFYERFSTPVAATPWKQGVTVSLTAVQDYTHGSHEGSTRFRTG